jgi:hypothetical protein
VIRVGYETGPKAFDGVLVEYDPAHAPQDHHGQPVLRDHFQCKWHVKPGEITYADLTDPAFTNATSQSFLQNAQVQYVPHGTGARFKLVTNWRLVVDDAPSSSSRCSGMRSTSMRCLTARRMPARWARWVSCERRGAGIWQRTTPSFAKSRAHPWNLGAARILRGPSRVAERSLRRDGNEAGSHRRGRFLLRRRHRQAARSGPLHFDRRSFKDLCASEKLLDDGLGWNPVTVGVRSFMHQFDNLESRRDHTLNLVPHFDGRYIRDPARWTARVLPELRTFIVAAAQPNDHIRLVVDVHVSLMASTAGKTHCCPSPYQLNTGAMSLSDVV